MIIAWQSRHWKVPLTCKHHGVIVNVTEKLKVIRVRVGCRTSYQFGVDWVCPHHLTADLHQGADAHG